MLPRPVIWPVGNSDIYSDASGLSFLAHSDHIAPELSALFPPAERALANLFMQGWQWRQPDLLRDKTAKGFWAGSPSVARWMLLEVLCRAGCAGKAAGWGWLAAPEREPGISTGVCCWGASRASFWGSCQAELCSQFIPAAACWKVCRAEGAPRKEGAQRAKCNTKCCLVLQVHPPVPPAACKARMAPQFQRGPRNPPCLHCHELCGHQVLSNTVHLLHGLQLLHNISLCNAFNSAFWCVSIKEWNPK